MKSVGIDIGTASIKIVEVQLTNKGLMVQNFVEFPLGQNPAFDSKIEIIEHLRSIAAKYPSDQVRMVVGLRQENVSVRNKIFPFADRLKIQKSMAFELEEDLPFSPENAIYDAKIVKVMGQSAEVLACATPKNRISDLLQLMQDAMLDVSVVSSEGIALANCWERWNDAPPIEIGTKLQMEGESRPARQVQIALNIGHTRTLVCALDSGRVIGVRSILWGGKNLAELLMRRYEIPYVEALTTLQTKSFLLLNEENSTYDQIVFSKVLADGIRDLARDVQMTILEFQSEFNGHVSAITVTGGVSQIPNLNALLTQALEAPVNIASILTGHFNVAFNFNPKVDAICGVALGLAIEGLKKPRNPALNFLKNEFQKQNQRFKKFWDDWGMPIKIASVSFVIFTVYSIAREQISASLVESATEALKEQAKLVAKLPAKQANEAGVKKFIKEQSHRSQDVKAVKALAKMNSAMDVLARISDAAPGKNSSNLKVMRIDIQNQKVEIEGSVARPQELTTLQTALTSLSQNGKIENIRQSLRPAGGVPFAFGFDVDRGIVTK